MSRNKCCMPGCTISISDGVPMHHFPNPSNDGDRFQAWKASVGLDRYEDSYIFSNRQVCHRHFKQVYHGSKNRLVRSAVPTLHLTGADTPPSFPVPVQMEQQQQMQIRDESILAHEGRSLDNPMGVEQATTFKIHPTTAGNNTGRSLDNPMDVEQATTSKIHPTTAGNNTGSKRRIKATTTTAQERQLMKSISKLNRMLRKKENLNISFKRRFKLAEKISSSTAFDILSQKMTRAAKLFFEMQITQSQKTGKGRRFTMDQKIMALSLYKPSPKAYRLLSQMCILPKRKTLQKLLAQVELKPGIQDTTFDQIRRKVAKMPRAHRYCTLVFDEMAIDASVHLDRSNDWINGLCDNGVERKKSFCDHALVMMVRGVIKKYKQPIAYSFCQSSTSTADIKKTIQGCIKKIQETGLKVVATVCDQGATNVAAINSLMRDTAEKYLRREEEYRGGFFEINEEIIFPIYDPPHLMKGIRNNLLTKDLEYKMNGQEGVAMWSDLQKLHRRAPGYNGVRMVSKLTAQHVEPAAIPKMKVKFCTQVFSKSVGVALGFMASEGLLPKRTKETADILLFFNNLFDSVNGSFSEPRGGNYLRSAVTPRSQHQKLWQKSLPVLKSMRFIAKNKNKVTVPTLSSWVKTIEGFQLIVEHFHKLGHRSLLLRHFNQDPLENFFGAVRSHGFSNIMPNTAAFESAYKTLLVNNLTSAHSVGANCEEDETECLQNLKIYFNRQSNARTPMEEAVIFEEDLNISLINTDTLLKSRERNDVEKCAAVAYCCGWLIKKAKQRVFKSCKTCLKSVETEKPEQFHSFIKLSEFNKDKTWLQYPNRFFFDFFVQIENVVQNILETKCNIKGITNYLELVILTNIDFTLINCEDHKKSLADYLIKKSIDFFVTNWCREINKILTNKVIISTDETFDQMKLAAKKYVDNKKGKRLRQTGAALAV